MPALVINVGAEIPGDVPNDQVDLIAADGTGEPIVLYEATPATGGFKPWFFSAADSRQRQPWAALIKATL